MKKKLKIVLALLVLFVVVFLAFILFFYYQTINTNQKNLAVLTHNRLTYASQRLLIGQAEIEDNAATLLVDNEVRNIRTSNEVLDDYEYLLQLNSISAKLKERLINSTDIADISIYWPTKDILISTESSPNLKNEIKNAPPTKGWRNTNRGLYFFISYTFGSSDEQTTVAVKATDALFLEAEEALSAGSEDAAFIMPDGQISSGSKVLRELISENKSLFKEAEERTPFRVEGSEKQFMIKNLSDSNIQLITTLPSKQFDQLYTQTTLLTIIAILFVLGVGVTLIFLYYKNVLTEISLLTSKLKMVERGDYDTRIDHFRQNEFDYLFNQFNLMTSSIQRLFKTLVKEMQQRELAEERQFQSQIQPHFLYNSLFYIVSVAENPKAVREMTRHLAEYYRYLCKETERVSLKDEVTFAEHYLTIQSLRKEFQFSIFIEEGIEETTILPLLLQPIIENAIEHGIEAKDGAHAIELRLKREGSKINISISDDGPGLSKIAMEELCIAINHSSRQMESVGLWNVNQRLKNIYGKDAGLKLTTNQWGGLTVSFTIDLKGGIMRP